MSKAKHPLYKTFFYTFEYDNDKQSVARQGYILDVFETHNHTMARCQMFEWLLGEESNVQVYPLAQLIDRKSAILFKDANQRDEWAERHKHLFSCEETPSLA
jgi:hypothetical protein